MDLEMLILSQIEKDKYRGQHLYVESKKVPQMKIFAKQRYSKTYTHTHTHTHTHKKKNKKQLMVTKGEKVGEE